MVCAVSYAERFFQNVNVLVEIRSEELGMFVAGERGEGILPSFDGCGWVAGGKVFKEVKVGRVVGGAMVCEGRMPSLRWGCGWFLYEGGVVWGDTRARCPRPGMSRLGLLVVFVCWCKDRGWRGGLVCEFALLWGKFFVGDKRREGAPQTVAHPPGVLSVCLVKAYFASGSRMTTR